MITIHNPNTLSVSMMNNIFHKNFPLLTMKIETNLVYDKVDAHRVYCIQEHNIKL